MEQARAFARECYDEALKSSKDGDSITQVAARILDRRIKKQNTPLRLALFELFFRVAVRMLVHTAIDSTRKEFRQNANGKGEQDSHNRVLARATANFMAWPIWGGKQIGKALPPELELSGRHFIAQGETMLAEGHWHLAVKAAAPNDSTPPEKYMTEEEMGRLYYAAQFKARKEAK
jgi:hypothetical protein